MKVPAERLKQVLGVPMIVIVPVLFATTILCKSLAGIAFSNDDAMDTAFGTLQSATDTLLTANDCHISPTTAAITISGTPAAEDLVFFQITRDGVKAVERLRERNRSFAAFGRPAADFGA